MATGFPRSTSLHLPVLYLLVVCLLSVPLSNGEERMARKVGFLLEGSFEDHALARKAEGATRTLIVPFYEWDYGVRSFSREEWEKGRLTWEKVMTLSSGLAKDLLEKIEPEVVRDERGIVQYVILVDKDPFLTGVILSPLLRESYRELLGDRVHAIPIDRNRIYLFPATGGTLADFGPALVDEFRRATLPVSLEIFLLDEEGYRAIGEIRRGSP